MASWTQARRCGTMADQHAVKLQEFCTAEVRSADQSCTAHALQRHRLWGELWWVGGGHRWIFFDDLEEQRNLRRAGRVLSCVREAIEAQGAEDDRAC